MEEKLWLSEAIIKHNIKFNKGRINIINSHAGSGKSYFIYKELLINPKKYIVGIKENPKWIYLTDTGSLKDSIMSDLDIPPIEKRRMIDLYNEKIMTYAKFGNLCREKSNILETYDFIICDELQNLYNYASNFTKGDNSDNYRFAIYYLERVCKLIPIIALSATPTDITEYLNKRKKSTAIYCRTFTNRQLLGIRSFETKTTYCTNNIFNFLKTYDFDANPNEKIFIGVPRIRQAKKLQKWFTDRNIQSIYLSSKSAHDNIPYETRKILKEDIPEEEKMRRIEKLNNSLMTEEQLKFREELLSDKIDDEGNYKRGQLQNYRVLIVTEAYETGINITDKNINIVLLAFSDRNKCIQMRSRVRKDIDILVCYPPKGYEQAVTTDFTDVAPKIEDKYFTDPIDDVAKQELIDKYGLVLIGKKKPNFISVKEYFSKYGYVFATVEHELKLFHSKEELNKVKSPKKKGRPRKEIKEVDTNDELKDYLDSLIGVKLGKEQKKELVDKINLTDSRGRQQGSIGSLNEYFGDKKNGLPYIIISRKIHGKMYWILSLA